MTATRITNATIVTMNPARDIVKGEILIEGNRIKAITPDGQTSPPVAPDARTIDAQGQIVIPGLIQSHFHSTQVIFRGLADELELMDWLRTRIWPMEIAHTAESNALGARMTAAELLRSGSTAIIDMGSAYHQDVVFETMRDIGFRGLFSKSMFDIPDQGAPHIAVQDTEECLRESELHLKKWHGAGHGRIGVAFALRFAPTSTARLLTAARDMGRANGIRLHTHCLENRTECDYVRQMFGMGYLQYLHHMGYTGEDVVLAHCIWVDDDDIRLLADTGSHAVHCPSSNMKLASGVAPLAAMDKAGVHLCMGLDGAHNHMDALVELRQAAVLQKVHTLSPVAFAPEKVLEMATLGGARAMGQEHDLGSVEVGKKADLVLLDMRKLNTIPCTQRHPVNQVVYEATHENVRLTMVDGAILYEDGHFTTIDLPQLIKDSERISTDFLSRPEIRKLF